VLVIDPADGSLRASLPAGDGPIDLAPVFLE
jgi:hypothetical protein